MRKDSLASFSCLDGAFCPSYLHAKPYACGHFESSCYITVGANITRIAAASSGSGFVRRSAIRRSDKRYAGERPRVSEVIVLCI